MYTSTCHSINKDSRCTLFCNRGELSKPTLNFGSVCRCYASDGSAVYECTIVYDSCAQNNLSYVVYINGAGIAIGYGLDD